MKEQKGIFRPKHRLLLLFLIFNFRDEKEFVTVLCYFRLRIIQHKRKRTKVM